MINAANRKATGGAASAMSRDKDFLFEAGVFARELKTRFNNLETKEDRVRASLAALKEHFPKASIRVDAAQRDETSPDKRFGTAAADNEVVIHADVLDSMTADPVLAEQVRQLFEGFLGGAWNKNLLDSREFEGQVWKSIDIQVDGVGYYESYHRPGAASPVAITNLRTEFDYRVGRNLDMLLGVDQERSGSTPGTADGGQSVSAQSLFGGSWRFSAYFSSAAFQSFGSGGTSGAENSSVLSGQSLETIQTRIGLQVTTAQSISVSRILGGMFGLIDPLILDLGGEGINLRPVEDGVRFDMRGNGSAGRTGFIQGNNALLYLDADGNGIADDINELFGDSQGHANGFEKLRRHDSNGDGLIDGNDAIFANLKLWRDLNGDGVNQSDESMTLFEAGVKSLNLRYRPGWEEDGKGNVVADRSSFTRADGSDGLIADVLFKTLM